MTIRTPSATVATEMLRAAFAERQCDIKLGEVNNLYARIMGYKNWAHFKKEQGGASVQPLTYEEAFQAELKDWKNWPVWIFTEDPETGDIQVLPFGSNLDNRHIPRYSGLQREGAFSPTVGILQGARIEELTDEFRPYHLLVEEIYSRVPDIGKYGLPDYAHDELSQRWLKEEMGWGYIVDERANYATRVNVDETGDDTCPEYWAQVRVSPEVHACLVQESKRLCNGQWRAVVPDVPLTDTSDALCVDVHKLFARVFSDMSDASVGEMMESLCGACTLELRQTVVGYCTQGEIADAGPEELFVYLASRLAVLLGGIDELGLPLSNPYSQVAMRVRKAIEKAAGSKLSR